MLLKGSFEIKKNALTNIQIDAHFAIHSSSTILTMHEYLL